MRISALLFDLDGVIRQWDDALDDRTSIETSAGLPPGAIAEIAFAPHLIQPAVTGQVTDEQWRASIAAELQSRFPHTDCAAVVQQWSASVGRVDQAMLNLVQHYRQQAPVFLLTNATTRLAVDLARLGIADAFDGVFNSAIIGYAKPSPEIFRAVLDTLGLMPTAVAFIDDTLSHVTTAAALGIHAIHYHDIAQVRESVDALLRAG